VLVDDRYIAAVVVPSPAGISHGAARVASDGMAAQPTGPVSLVENARAVGQVALSFSAVGVPAGHIDDLGADALPLSRFTYPRLAIPRKRDGGAIINSRIFDRRLDRPVTAP
jgi:hypothetical protein